MNTIELGDYAVSLFDEATGKTTSVKLIVQHTGVFISLEHNGEEVACVGAEVWENQFRSLSWPYDENYAQQEPVIQVLAEVESE